MATEHDDALIAKRYRELAREEPPPALDAAILAAARRAAGERPRASKPAARPAAGPFGRRWALPLSLAAVLVLTVGVVLRVQLERPDSALPLPPLSPSLPPRAFAPAPGAAPAGGKPAETALSKSVQQDAVQAAKPDAMPAERARAAAGAAPAAPPVVQAAKREVLAAENERQPEAALKERQPEAALAEQPAPRAAAASRAPAGERALADVAAAPAAAPAPVAASAAAAPPPAAVGSLSARRDSAEELPERWLERIVQLRKDGRDKEADESFAQFRRRHPDYVIPEATRKQLMHK